MIKKLRRKFMAVAMISVTLVILTRDGEVVSIDTGRIAAVSTEQAVDLFMLS